MSDLAPFVASVLRDKVIADQLEEVRDLRRQLKSARQVAIVDGNTVITESQLGDGYAIDATRWNVEFEEVPLSVSSLQSAQLNVGGVNRATVVGSADEAFADEYDEETMRLEASAYYNPALWITFQVGPVTRSFFEETQHLQAPALFERLIEKSEEQPQMRLYWKSAMFSGGSANVALDDMKLQSRR